jgi:hypothetical protein
MKHGFSTAPRNIFYHAEKKATATSTEIIFKNSNIPLNLTKNVFLWTARAVLKRNRLFGCVGFWWGTNDV